jgi:hypothetical protein
MRTVSDVLQNHGGHVEFTTKEGKTVKVKYLTLKAMSEYENKLQNKAIRQLAQQKDAIPSDMYMKMFSELMDNVAVGHYAFGSELCSKSLTTIQGISSLISILCDVSEDEALELLTNNQDDFKLVFDEVVRKSIGSKDEEKEEDTEKKR